ncbi:hypothetical protein CAPTEDRAFT_71664, partial [Capitella teleta]
STGHDNLSPYHMKLLISCLLHPLQILINRIITEGKFPTSLKASKIKLIHKRNEMDLMNNYRPISLLPVTSKIIEKIL